MYIHVTQYVHKDISKASTYIPLDANRYAKGSKTVIFHLETLGNPWIYGNSSHQVSVSDRRFKQSRWKRQAYTGSKAFQLLLRRTQEP